ncbi:MAG: 50S ribosomal protein L4 [Oscillospiraceae bacterium]|nr:50S ribosomal protein L4 [Oscillospiraceae bacterium]
MPNVKVVDMSGNETGTKEISDDIFDARVNESLIHSVVRAYLSNQRIGTHSTLTRAEVRGGGAKPWRQKGTGRARQGSRRNPQWTHGGVAFGPKPRSYRVQVNKKARKAALKGALTSKLKNGEFIVVDSITATEYKTKNIVNMLASLEAGKKALIVLGEHNEKLIKSAANIPGVKTAVADNLNVYDIINCGKFIASSGAVDKIEEVYA